jgi:hypothetical protein
MVLFLDYNLAIFIDIFLSQVIAVIFFKNSFEESTPKSAGEINNMGYWQKCG